jgi:signal transduction histidine kinase/ligand-binding sensor domain-containing protein
MTAATNTVYIDARTEDPSKLASRFDHRFDRTSTHLLTLVQGPCRCSISIFLIALAGIVLPFPAWAIIPSKILSGYYHTSWTAKDELPGAVLSIAQTTDGFLWIGGSAGLFRFDGLVMERYTPENGVLLQERLESALLATPDGGLWIGYNDGGISFLKNGRVTNFTERDGFPTGLVRVIVLDRDGVIWASVAGGLARYDGKHWLKIQTDWGFPGKSAFSVVVDREGAVWVTSEDRIYALSRGEKRFQDAGLSTTAGVLLLAPDNVFWLTEPHKNSIVRLRMLAGKLSRSSTVIQASDWTPIFDHNGGLWIGSWGNGILHIPSPGLLPEGSTSNLSPGVETFTETQGLSDNHATRFFEDREGNIWIATNEGLNRLRRSSVSWFALQPGTHSFSLIPSVDGEIIAASYNGGMVRVPQGTMVSGAPKNVLMSYRAPDDAVWLNCDDGSALKFTGSLVEWKDHRFIRVGVPPDVHTINVGAMTTDHAGNLWISFAFKGTYKFRDGVWTHVDLIKDNPNRSASWAITDSKGQVWLAFPRRKLVAQVSAGGIKSFSTDGDISIGPVDLLSQSGGPVWAAGSLGVAIFVHDRFHAVIADDGRTFAEAYSLVATGHDGVWLTAPQGIFHIPQDEVEHVVRDPSYKIRYELFDQRSDLPDPLQTENGTVISVQGTDRLLWFATRNGVARIDPQNIARNLLAPPVSIRSISADGTKYDPDSSPSLPALVKDLRIDYTALSLTVPERARFRYRLDGWDRDWIDAGSRRQAFYTNLSPGSYRFHVIACNSDGVWNDLGATLKFAIAPSWFQTTWFRIACGIVVILILWALYHLRLRQVGAALTARFNERLSERARIAQDLHDTFLQTIQGSKLVADDALDGPSDLTHMRQAMVKISGWLAQATVEERAVLNSLRTSTTETNGLAEALKRATEDCSIPCSIALDFVVIGEASEMHPIIRDEIYRIGFEAIRNAAVHSCASVLEIELIYGHNLTLRVADNGAGIDLSVINQGKQGHFGLQGMRERAARIGATFTLTSSSGSGTEIRLVVPGAIIFQKQEPIHQTLLTKLRDLIRQTI